MIFYPQAIDMFMSSCTFFVFLSLIEYAFVNVMMGDIRWDFDYDDVVDGIFSNAPPKQQQQPKIQWN